MLEMYLHLCGSRLQTFKLGTKSFRCCYIKVPYLLSFSSSYLLFFSYDWSFEICCSVSMSLYDAYHISHISHPLPFLSFDVCISVSLDLLFPPYSFFLISLHPYHSLIYASFCKIFIFNDFWKRELWAPMQNDFFSYCQWCVQIRQFKEIANYQVDSVESGVKPVVFNCR